MQGTGSIETFDVSDHSGDVVAPFTSAFLVLAICAFLFLKSFGRRS